GVDRRADRFRAVRVDERAQAERVGLAARRLQLLVGHRLFAALADAGRGEQLDEIRARRLRLADRGAQIVRRAETVRLAAAAGPSVELPHRGEDARAGQVLLVERLAQLQIAGLANALDRGEAGHHRGGGVGDARLHAGVSAFTARHEPAVGAEVPEQVHVRV